MDNYYYLNEHNEQKGPVPADQLLSCGVTRETKVWKSGMGQEWKQAGSIAELAHLFISNCPPPPPPDPFKNSYQQKPDNLLVWSILSTVLCCLPLGIVAIIYSTKVDPLWNEGKQEEARKAAAQAKLYCLIALGLGVLGGIIGFIIGLVGSL